MEEALQQTALLRSPLSSFTNQSVSSWGRRNLTCGQGLSDLLARCPQVHPHMGSFIRTNDWAPEKCLEPLGVFSPPSFLSSKPCGCCVFAFENSVLSFQHLLSQHELRTNQFQMLRKTPFPTPSAPCALGFFLLVLCEIVAIGLLLSASQDLQVQDQAKYSSPSLDCRYGDLGSQEKVGLAPRTSAVT